MSRPLTIKRVADATGLGVETLRFYEREGIIAPPPRSASGYRHYPAETVQRLRFVRRAKELGFSLKEIRELLSLSENDDATAGDFKRLALHKLAEVEERIRDLTRIRDGLATLSEECPGGGAETGCCPILGALEGTVEAPESSQESSASSQDACCHEESVAEDSCRSPRFIEEEALRR